MPIPQEYIDRVRQHAKQYYEHDGWDYLVESVDDNEIREQFHPEWKGTYHEFFTEVSMWMRELDSHRKDIQGTAW